MRVQRLKALRKVRRKKHIKKVIRGNTDRYRLTVFKSLSNIYAQIINDVDGVTIVSASSLDKELKQILKPEMSKKEQSELVGKELAKRAVEKNIKSVAFDRNGYIYHGRIQSLAEGARKGGLEF